MNLVKKKKKKQHWENSGSNNPAKPHPGEILQFFGTDHPPVCCSQPPLRKYSLFRDDPQGTELLIPGLRKSCKCFPIDFPFSLRLGPKTDSQELTDQISKDAEMDFMTNQHQTIIQGLLNFWSSQSRTTKSNQMTASHQWKKCKQSDHWSTLKHSSTEAQSKCEPSVTAEDFPSVWNWIPF